jgi:hypothetical protein
VRSLHFLRPVVLCAFYSLQLSLCLEDFGHRSFVLISFYEFLCHRSRSGEGERCLVCVAEWAAWTCSRARDLSVPWLPVRTWSRLSKTPGLSQRSFFCAQQSALIFPPGSHEAHAVFFRSDFQLSARSAPPVLRLSSLSSTFFWRRFVSLLSTRSTPIVLSFHDIASV